VVATMCSVESLCSAGCGWWLVLIYCEKKVLLADCGLWLVLIWCERNIVRLQLNRVKSQA